MMNLVCKWLKNDIGGLAKMAERNRDKAKLLYDVLDGEFYRGHARTDCRSLMNVTFRLPSEDLEKAFVKEAEKHQLLRAQRPPLRRRHSRLDLQRHAAGGCESAAQLHG